jgi:hypothetical protein
MVMLAAIVGTVLAAGLAWFGFPAFVSGSEKWATAPFAFFLTRLLATVIAGIAGGLLAEAYFSPPSRTSLVVATDSSGQAAVASKPPVQPVRSPATAATSTSGSTATRNTASAPALAPTRQPSQPASSPRDVEHREIPDSQSRASMGGGMEQQAAIRPDARRGLDVSALDCDRPIGEYQTLVCEDPPLRRQEDRILKTIRAQLAAAASDADASEIASKFTAFKSALKACVYKICIETAYEDFERELGRQPTD